MDFFVENMEKYTENITKGNKNFSDAWIFPCDYPKKVIKKMKFMCRKWHLWPLSYFDMKYLLYSNIMPRLKNICRTSLILPICLYITERLLRRFPLDNRAVL
jgi:hypothetical protein